MKEIFNTTATIGGITFPLVMEYSQYHRGQALYIGWMTTFSFSTFLRYIKEYSTFPYILAGVTILTYHTGTPASLLNKVYDYRVRFYKVKVDNTQLKLL